MVLFASLSREVTLCELTWLTEGVLFQRLAVFDDCVRV